MAKPSTENPVKGRGREPVPDAGKPQDEGQGAGQEPGRRPRVEVHRPGFAFQGFPRSERPLLVLLGGALGILAFRGLARPGARAALAESLRPGEKRVRLSDLVSIASSAAWLIQRWRKRGLG
jgi:hypothetical protein